MGAEYCEMFVNSEDKNEVKDAFRREQESDRHENGHSYSGGFGMAPSLTFNTTKVFESRREAEEFLNSACQKWEVAIAIPMKNKDGKIGYLIGAVCSSQERNNFMSLIQAIILVCGFGANGSFANPNQVYCKEALVACVYQTNNIDKCVRDMR